MYGPGGLSDLAGAFSGLGGLGLSPGAAALLMNRTMSNQQAVLSVVASQASNPPLDSPPPGVDVNARCDCLVSGIADSFDNITPGQIAELRAACQQNVTDFESALRAQASTVGVSIPSCTGPGGGASEPWYKQPKYLVAGGLGLAAIGLVIWKMA